MRKFLSFTLACLSAFTLTACGSASDVSENTTNTSSGNNETVQQNVSEENPISSLFHPAVSGCYATIKIDSSVKMDDTSACYMKILGINCILQPENASYRCMYCELIFGVL